MQVHGEFFDQHRDEIIHLMHNEAEAAMEQHPLERIMSSDTSEGYVLISTTGIHLARRLGEALYHAYHGDLSVKYSSDEYRVRVTWSR